MPSRPCLPPESHTSRGTIPSFSHCAWNGATVFSAHARTMARNSSCSDSYREWRMTCILPDLSEAVPAVGGEAVDDELARGRRRRQRPVVVREGVDAEHELHR